MNILSRLISLQNTFDSNLTSDQPNEDFHHLQPFNKNLQGAVASA
jgi:hypothetical protein